MTLLGTNGPGEEDLGALRWVAMDRHVYPYLHRNRMAGHSALNRLVTDLNMGGHDQVGINSLFGARLLVTENLGIGGELDVTDMEIAGNLSIGGNLVSTGSLSVARMSTAGSTTIFNLDVEE